MKCCAFSCFAESFDAQYTRKCEASWNHHHNLHDMWYRPKRAVDDNHKNCLRIEAKMENELRLMLLLLTLQCSCKNWIAQWIRKELRSKMLSFFGLPVGMESATTVASSRNKLTIDSRVQQPSSRYSNILLPNLSPNSFHER